MTCMWECWKTETHQFFPQHQVQSLVQSLNSNASATVYLLWIHAHLSQKINLQSTYEAKELYLYDYQFAIFWVTSQVSFHYTARMALHCSVFALLQCIYSPFSLISVPFVRFTWIVIDQTALCNPAISMFTFTFTFRFTTLCLSFIWIRFRAENEDLTSWLCLRVDWMHFDCIAFGNSVI